MINILHLRASNFYGGPERQLHHHAKLASGSEFEITIGSFLERGRTPEFIEAISRDGIQTHVFAVNSAYDPSAVRIVRSYLNEGNFDIICTHDYRTQVVGMFSVRGTDAKWIAFSRGWTRENFKVRLFHCLDRIIIRFADQIVAISNSQKRRLTRLLVPASRITVIPNSIDISAFESMPPVDLRGRFNLGPDTTIVVSGGRFSREKGQKCMVLAAAEAIKENASLRFILFGDGPDLENIRRMISMLSLDDKVICPGFERNLIGCIKGADILVNPSLSEAMPNIVLEGMALGVPVVATAVGGVPDLITHGESGHLAKAGDSRSLANGILEVAAEKNMALKLSETALEFVKKNCTFRKQYEELSAIYLKTAG